MSQTYRFLFVGFGRPTNPLDGTQMPERIWEYRSVPGDVRAWSSVSEEEAVSRMQAALQRAFSLNARGVDGWYEEALRKMSDDDRAEYSEFFMAGEFASSDDFHFPYRNVDRGARDGAQEETAA